MGFRLSGQVLETSTGLTPAQKLMLLGLAERADRQGRYAFPSVATLAQYAECSERTVELGLQALVAGGWITVQRKATNRMPTTYVVNLERLSRGEESSPQNLSLPMTARGEDSCTPGAKFSTSRGEETSPDPVSKEPIQQEPIQGERPADAGLPSPAQLVVVWNETRFPGPRVTDVTPQRDRAYRRALAARPVLDDWRRATVWLNRQAYANAPGTGVHPTWRASLDWLAKPGQLASILESAQTDALSPPQRPRRVGDTPSEGMTAADAEVVQERARRRQDSQAEHAALLDEASHLVLELSDHARRPLERDALDELEPFRARVSAAEFDEWVCKALPLKLIRRANGRPLADVVRELEAAAA